MDANDYLKIVMEAAEDHVHDCFDFTVIEPPSINKIREALAFLKDKHVFLSRFKVGDRIVVVVRSPDPREKTWWVENTTVDLVFFDGESLRYQHDNDEHDESDCFPTCAEAEAECARRNKETP